MNKLTEKQLNALYTFAAALSIFFVVMLSITFYLTITSFSIYYLLTFISYIFLSYLSISMTKIYTRELIKNKDIVINE